MKRICVLAGVLALVACTESLETRLASARSELERGQQQLESTKLICAYGPQRSVDEVRKEALAEWDVAAAQSVDDISREQEWEIRKSLGAEMGLAPSEVNGWKDIYRGRAEQAKRALKRGLNSGKVDQEIRGIYQQAACDNALEFQKGINFKMAEISRLEGESREYANAPGFFSYVGYSFLTLLAIGVGGWIAIDVIDKRHIKNKLLQIRLDGLLMKANLFTDQITDEQMQEIISAHANKDVELLSEFVRNSAPPHLKRLFE